MRTLGALVGTGSNPEVRGASATWVCLVTSVAQGIGWIGWGPGAREDWDYQCLGED